MIIDNIDVELADIKLTRPYTIAYKTTSSIKNIFVKIILSDGTIGLGSSNVSKYVVGLDTSESYKNTIDFKNELIDCLLVESLFYLLETYIWKEI